MASDVDICNLALSHLGDEATVAAISPSDGSQQADYCVRFYPIARDQLLCLHAWSFATKRIALALIDTDELPDTWAYAYAVPSGSLQVISVLPPQGTGQATLTSFPPDSATNSNLLSGDQNTQDFIQEVLQDGTKCIFTNTEDAIARYVAGITDTTKFNALFVTACARLLASYLAGPLLKGETGIKVASAHFKTFTGVELPWAAAMDQKGQKQNVYKNFVPDGLAARA